MQQQPIWHAASRLTKAFGDEAPKKASQRAHELLEAGDIERRKNWLRVMTACKSLQQTDQWDS